MDRYVDSRRPSPHQVEMAAHQARNVASSKVGTAILVANARSGRQLEEKIKALERAKDMELRRLNWEQNQLRKSPNLRRHEMGSRCSLDSRRSATYLDGIATPVMHRRRETFHAEPRSVSCLSHNSPDLALSRRIGSNLLKRPDTPRPQSLTVMLPSLQLRSMPNLSNVEEDEDAILSPKTSLTFPKRQRERNSQTTLMAHREESSLKSKSFSSFCRLESPTSQARAFTDRSKHKTLPILNVPVQCDKWSSSLTKLNRSENSS